MSEENDNVDFSYEAPALQYGRPPNRRISHPKAASGLGIAGMVLGMVGCLLCWVPLLGMLSLPILAIGLLLSFLGLVIAIIGRRSRAGFAIAGILTCGVGAVVAIGSTAGFFSLISKAAESNSPTNSVSTSTDLGSDKSLDDQIADARRKLDQSIQDQREAEKVAGDNGPVFLAAEHKHIDAQQSLDKLLAEKSKIDLQASADAVQATRDAGASMENFLAIKDGMTYDEVKKIIGFGGEENESGGGMMIISWKGNSLISSLTVSFINGHVAAKSQIGLK